MIAKDDFEGANATLTAPSGMPNCSDLRVRYDTRGDCWTSIWIPSPEELIALTEGKGVAITLWGMHPPVYVGVEGITDAMQPEGKAS